MVRKIRLILVWFMLILAPYQTLAQASDPRPPILVAVECTRQDNTEIAFFGLNADGEPLGNDTNLSISTAGNLLLEQPSLVARRSISVLYIMDVSGSTAEPMSALGGLVGQFFTRLSVSPQDQVAFMTVSDAASDPVSLADMAALESRLQSLPISENSGNSGIALYDALQKGVLYSANQNADLKVILVVTDSVDASGGGLEAVMRAAIEADVRIFAIGYHTEQEGSFVRNVPDSQLRTITDQTGGFAWIMDANNPPAIPSLAFDVGNRVLRRINDFNELFSLEWRVTFAGGRGDTRLSLNNTASNPVTCPAPSTPTPLPSAMPTNTVAAPIIDATEALTPDITQTQTQTATAEPPPQVAIAATPVPPVIQAPPPAPPIGQIALLLLLLGLSGGLFVVDGFLWRAIREKRVDLDIEREDAADLPTNLMTIQITDSANQHYADNRLVTKKTYLIGRGADNDLQLGNDNRISSEHGAVLWRRRRWYYTNRKRQVTTIVDGRSVKGKRLIEIKAGMTLQIADLSLRLGREQEDTGHLAQTIF